MLPPLADNKNEVHYFPRRATEEGLRQILSPTFSNEYYLIHGEIGTGKTRMILELVRDMHKEQISKHKGAPIYVLASQGKSFPETLGAAVSFHFDEHLSFSLFMDFLLGVRSFPSQDTHHRLHRVLLAIEESAFEYAQCSGCPVVLIIDGTDNLDKHLPGTLAKLQDKAKLWADTNIAKVVFVTNDEETEEIFKENPGSWSRMGASFRIHDLTEEETIRFLCEQEFMENDHSDKIYSQMNVTQARYIYNLVGGRVSQLIIFKREYLKGIPIAVTASRLQEKDQEKFVCASKDPRLLSVIDQLKQAPKKNLLLSRLVSVSSRECVLQLAKQNVIKFERDHEGVHVTFESRLTENVAQQLDTKN